MIKNLKHKQEYQVIYGRLLVDGNNCMETVKTFGVTSLVQT